MIEPHNGRDTTKKTFIYGYHAVSEGPMNGLSLLNRIEITALGRWI